MAVREGWKGRFYEDFEVGDVYEHPLGRTITTADNVWFTLLTQNTAPVHFDHHYAAQTEFRKPLVNSCLTLALVTGQSVTDISQNVLANLGWDEVRLPNPVFEGDTVYSRSEVLEKRESTSRDNVGIVSVRTTRFNQQGTEVITYKRRSWSISRARRRISRGWNLRAPDRASTTARAHLSESDAPGSSRITGSQDPATLGS